MQNSDQSYSGFSLVYVDCCCIATQYYLENAYIYPSVLVVIGEVFLQVSVCMILLLVRCLHCTDSVATRSAKVHKDESVPPCSTYLFVHWSSTVFEDSDSVGSSVAELSCDVLAVLSDVSILAVFQIWYLSDLRL